MNLDLDALAAAANAIAGSALGWEMAVRIGQSLEITDALWDLVPVVVAAGEQVDELSAAQAADLSPAARGLDDDNRARIRSLGDAFTGVLDEAVAAQLADESALGSLTPAEVMADPFGTVGALIDLPATCSKRCLQQRSWRACPHGRCSTWPPTCGRRQRHHALRCCCAPCSRRPWAWWSRW